MIRLLYTFKFITVILLINISCTSSLKKDQEATCYSSYAQKLGYDDAVNGRSGKPGLLRGDICKGFEPYPYESFYRDYNLGEATGLKEWCVVDNAKKLGASDGENARTDQPGIRAFDLCIQREIQAAALQSNYKSSFTATFCNPSVFESMGKNRAEKFDKTPVESSINLCSSQTRSRLRTAYNKGFDAQMKVFCTPIGVASHAVEDARSELSLRQGVEKISFCPAASHENLLASYRSTYGDEKTKINEERRIEIERQRLQQQMEIEKERLRVEKQRLANDEERLRIEKENQRLNQQNLTSTSSNNRNSRLGLVKIPGSSRSSSGSDNTNWQTNAQISNNRILMNCAINRGKSIATLKNSGNNRITGGYNFELSYYDSKGSLIKSNKTSQSIRLNPGDTSSFTNYAIPSGSTSCLAKLI